jgi:predicted ester cyclase
MSLSGINIDRIVDGKFVERWYEMDRMGLMQQLGVIPAPGQSEEASPT